MNRETLILLANAAFMRAGVPTPRMIFLKTPGCNVFVVPTPRKPVLVIAGDLSAKLSTEQIEAVFLHEAAHLACKHFSKRILANLSALLWTASGLVVLFLIAVVLLPPQWVVLVAFFAPIPAAVAQIGLFSRALRAQEFEADRVAVEKLGADPDQLASAIRNLSGDESPSAAAKRWNVTGVSAWLQTHPPTAEREVKLRALVPVKSSQSRAA